MQCNGARCVAIMRVVLQHKTSTYKSKSSVAISVCAFNQLTEPKSKRKKEERIDFYFRTFFFSIMKYLQICWNAGGNTFFYYLTKYKTQQFINFS